ncbi:hypothetical protein BDV96DRAFT_564987 [Lophiotrema nucula]|uniref:Pentatricopeptide repeat domain-containing protein n=1 Tax=Lophiotrema nucula TaxID=690887 RepID=A0A6A5ZMP4_9PLEO|nr:hypothetical protein BDV96DRAFT_564987 [Lophiotrema nucula]
MQAIWSRAARNPGTCKCIQCMSNASAVARRNGANGIRGAWAFGTPTSTFIYTSIFAAGIAIDAKAKQRRNEQWEAAFAHLREEVAQAEETGVYRRVTATLDQGPFGRRALRDHIFEETSLPSPDVVPLSDIWPNGVDWDFIHRAAGMHLIEDPVLLERQSLAQVTGEDITEKLWRLVPFDSRFPGTQALKWPVNTGPPLNRRNLPPQSLWSLDNLREKALRNRHTWKKIAIQELSVGWLVHNLLHQARSWELPTPQLNELSQPIRDIASLLEVPTMQIQQKITAQTRQIQKLPSYLSADDILKVKTYDIPSQLPSYHQDPDGDFLYTCKALNAALMQLLFDSGEPRDSSAKILALAKICHNLLISSTAPDVQTYNILITGLKRWKLHSMTDSVIEAMLKSQIRPNEITCATVLDHYIQTTRPKEFGEFVGLMRGVGNALMLARPDVQINEVSSGRLIRVDEKKVYQKIYATPLVHNVLMHGALRFAGFDRAMEIYYEMKTDGWGLDLPGLSQLLADCIFRADWDGGLYVWKEITAIKEQAEKSDINRAYATMLSLASVAGQGRAFRQIHKEVEQCGLDGRKILKLALEITEKINKRQLNRPRIYGGDHILIALMNYRDDVAAEVPPSPSHADPLPSTDSNEDVIISESAGDRSPQFQPTDNPWSGIDRLIVKRVEEVIQEDNKPNHTLEAASTLDKGFEEKILGDAALSPQREAEQSRHIKSMERKGHYQNISKGRSP